MAEQLSKQAVAAVQQIVYLRRITDAALFMNGEQGDWIIEPRLRCDWVRHEMGSRGGSAQFTFIPPSIDDTTVAFEEAMAAFSTDDQVRVEVFPPVDPLVQQQPTDPPTGKLRFEGVLRRHQFVAQAEGGRDVEAVTLLAQALPNVMNDQTEHIIGGRWVPYGTNGAKVIESLSLPPVFNYRGRPNRDTAHLIKAALPAGGYDPSVADLEAFVFTHDDDPRGRYWTLRQALASIVLQWLYGVNDLEGNPYVRPRTIMLHPDTLGLLKGNLITDADVELPETNILGMGVLDAINAVCEAAGWLWACELSDPLEPGEPDEEGQPSEEDEALAADWRPYWLRIWRRNFGLVKWADMAKRSAVDNATPEDTLARNTVNKAAGIVDRASVANEIFGVGRVVIEHRWTLLPLWAPSDVHNAAINAALQTATESQLIGTGYHSRHVTGGIAFQTYAHVGRAWGIAHEAGVIGYPSGPYMHPAAGFDWVAELGLNAITGLDYNAVYLERNSNNVTPADMWWMQRPRRALPLRHPGATSIDREFFLEVSEDGGTTWKECTARFSTMRDRFGIMFLNIPNLASMNNASVGTERKPAVEQSWWALIQTEQLRLRLTAGVEADHGAKYNARRQAISASRYYLGQMLPVELEERWASPTHAFETSGAWRKLPTINASDAVTSATVKDATVRRRDHMQHGVLSASITSWQMVFDRWRLGDQVAGLRGRDYSFAVGTGDQTRYPAVVGITEQLGDAQAIVLTLDDQRLTVGR